MKEHVATILELVYKVVRAGYYWPTIQADAMSKSVISVNDSVSSLDSRRSTLPQ